MHRTFSQPGMWRKQDEDKSGWLTERQLAEGVKLVYCVARVLGLSVFQSANRSLISLCSFFRVQNQDASTRFYHRVTVSFKGVSDGLGKCPSPGAFCGLLQLLLHIRCLLRTQYTVNPGEMVVRTTKPFVFWV